MSVFDRLFGRNKKQLLKELDVIKMENVKKKAEIDTKLDMLNKYVDDNPKDIAARFFIATGGDKRMK